jgi:bifunctional DNA-binding transcriptional regulator/antitoxin component of YhaV-PrlF toxin-antitoxin module
MPTLKLHYDGWIALPVRLRQALGLSSGDRLEAELADGALVLRPVGKTRGSAPAQGAAVPATVQATELLPPAAEPMPGLQQPICCAFRFHFLAAVRRAAQQSTLHFTQTVGCLQEKVRCLIGGGRGGAVLDPNLELGG